MTKIVKQILILNLIFFGLANLLKLPFMSDFILYPLQSKDFNPLQFFGYMFLHGSITHIVFNMIGLVVFGCELERLYGSRKFLQIYLLSGIFAGIFHMVFINSPAIGASGAVWCLMVLYTLNFPDHIFNIYFVIPAKIKYIVGVYFVVELFLFITDSSDGVSHAAHVGGALSGLFAYKTVKSF